MSYVNPSTQSVKTFFQSRYSLPFFQREYNWQAKHYTELLEDIQDAFLLHYDATHARNQVSAYLPYFLGSVITSVENGGTKPLVDGQQRLTSIFLLLAYLNRYRVEKKIEKSVDLASFLGSTSYGAIDYNIEFSARRKEIFNKFNDHTKDAATVIDEAGDIANLDEGDKKILEALRSTDDLITDEVKGAIAYFIDYVLERVLLIDISVTNETEAHRVFVTMNDRGLRLGPIDLLKGLILSKISDPAKSQECHTAWMDMINALKMIDPEEDSLFFRNLFRAKWAETMRGKTKGDPAGDFDVIGDAYHRWFEDNASKLGLITGDDYIRFVTVDLKKYASIYMAIKAAESSLTTDLEPIYYNALRKFSGQSMILLSAVSLDDLESDWKKKVGLVATYIDLILTMRTIDGKQNNYDNLKEISFQLTKQVRNHTFDELMKIVESDWDKQAASIDNVSAMTYTKSDRMGILYVLARIASFLEESMTLTNITGFTAYMQRDKGAKTFDIEHIFAEAFNTTKLPATHGFADIREYSALRNNLGALVLLPRSRNRSLQAAAYADKIASYSTETILASSLTPQFYQNHPNVVKFLTDNPTLNMVAKTDFTKDDIDDRGKLYTEVSRLIWRKP
ncbi:DUF262 domain-containing protein [Ensifer sp. ENS08]|uniref:GmrSD restriction endonuclease domain-containing protein n=1 Tax=Ensifer sp. ENS08 TaxID=2769273 RepID=UPI0007298478|nr:DUF262 domain-containing protein [Ensifer sp. ENS08]KSV72258.1 hypothetical protein N182_29455 [Sinorhizobium sp. GL2]MBD9569913.1 DUF262 domain-containing protein [Ensifer sp. ENS08]